MCSLVKGEAGWETGRSSSEAGKLSAELHCLLVEPWSQVVASGSNNNCHPCGPLLTSAPMWHSFKHFYFNSRLSTMWAFQKDWGLHPCSPSVPRLGPITCLKLLLSHSEAGHFDLTGIWTQRSLSPPTSVYGSASHLVFWSFLLLSNLLPLSFPVLFFHFTELFTSS